MTTRQWVYLVTSALVAALGVFIAADLEHLTVENWSVLLAPKYVLGSAMAMLVAIVNYLKQAP